MEGRIVGTEIKNLVNGIERENPDLSATARVKKAWNTAVDSRIKEHVTAVFIVPNTAASEVIVYVDSSIWATELNMQAELLRLKLNIELNASLNDEFYMARRAEQVEKLKFVVSKEQYYAPSRRMTTFEQLEQEERELKNIQPVSLSDEEIQGIQEAVAHIENDELREAAYAAAKGNLEWQKGIREQKEEPKLKD